MTMRLTVGQHVVMTDNTHPCYDLVGRVEAITVEVHDSPNIPSPFVFIHCYFYGVHGEVLAMPEMLRAIKLNERHDYVRLTRFNLLKMIDRANAQPEPVAAIQSKPVIDPEEVF